MTVINFDCRFLYNHLIIFPFLLFPALINLASAKREDGCILNKVIDGFRIYDNTLKVVRLLPKE